MGDEIASCHFHGDDFDLFTEKLRAETDHLKTMFDERRFSRDHGVGGFELEAWLVDGSCNPAPLNKPFLEHLGDPLVGSELAMFNIELNTVPHRLGRNALRKMHDDLEAMWRDCRAAARRFDLDTVTIGILPTLNDDHLIPANLSDMKRYRALNDQLMQLRQGQPFVIDIQGKERLHITHADVMLEAATTALQIQLQVDCDRSVRFYNASLILSSAMAAVSANSPFMFGKELWAETRIPVFEQSLAESREAQSGYCGPDRVTFGFDYAKESLYEFFVENRDYYKVILPMVYDEASERFCHLRLHNGTIWRWNRPLVGVDDSGETHLRIEHRVAPSGSTLVDIIANAAFYFGLAESLAGAETPPESRLSFAEVRANFYRAAKDGLDAELIWLEGAKATAGNLIADELVPLAREGLEAYGTDRRDTDFYLGVIAERARTGRNGSWWQRAYVQKHSCDAQRLCEAYIRNQESGAPVHEWKV